MGIISTLLFYLLILSKPINQLYGHYTTVGLLPATVATLVFVQCDKWKNTMPTIALYASATPKVFFIDNSYSNFNIKKNYLMAYKNMVLVTPSNWLKNLVQQSFLNCYPVKVIHNGIDLTKFVPTQNEVFKNKIGAQHKNIIFRRSKYFGIEEKA